QRCRPQAFGVQIARSVVAAQHNHALAIARARMARRAIDVEPLLPALQYLRCHREGKSIALLAVHQASVEVAVLMQLVACHSVRHLWTHRAAVSEERRSALRDE